MSSVPSSPALMSPASTSFEGTSVSASCTPIVEFTCPAVVKSAAATSTTTSAGLAAQQLPGSSGRPEEPRPSSKQQQAMGAPDLGHLLTDTDILVARRNKLVTQLEEAHQLEECIVRRNNVIIERILKKYYDESQSSSSNEIAEFRQFTRLKSLLLKDSHDVADRIDSAESQLTELKRSSQCKQLL